MISLRKTFLVVLVISVLPIRPVFACRHRQAADVPPEPVPRVTDSGAALGGGRLS